MFAVLLPFNVVSGTMTTIVSVIVFLHCHGLPHQPLNPWQLLLRSAAVLQMAAGNAVASAAAGEPKLTPQTLYANVLRCCVQGIPGTWAQQPSAMATSSMSALIMPISLSWSAMT